MEIRKGPIPPAVQNEASALESNKTADASQVSAKDSSNIGGLRDPSVRPIPDSLEQAEPPNAFQGLEGQAIGNLDQIAGRDIGRPEHTEEPGSAADLLRNKKPGLDLSDLVRRRIGESTSTPIPKFIANTDRLELQQRLQDAADATMGLRMKNSGAGASEIAAALHAGGESAEDVAKELKDLGFSGEEVAVALRNEYQQNPVAMAETMKTAGFDATEIAKGLKEALSQDSGQVRDILERLGYSQVEIADAMWGAFQIGQYTTLD